MKIHFKKSKIASVICLALASSTVFAAEESKKNAKNDDTEVIEVTGVRGTLSAELAAKRASDAISDSIIAEDIGKSSDENIAEAISRIAGVSLDGDGNTVTVRGIEAALNDIKLNGISMTSSTDDQAVDLSLFSADMLSRIDVVKSPSANQEEGSLGASINLQTRAPLSSKKSTHSLSIEGRYDELSEEITPRFSYSFIENFSENLGFSGSFFHDTQNKRQENFSTNGYRLKHYYNSALGGEKLDNNSIGTKLYDFDSGEALTEITALSGGAFKNRIRLSETVKKGGTFTVQYQPGENTDIRLDTTFSRQDSERTQSTLAMKNFDNKTYDDSEIYVHQEAGKTNTVYRYARAGVSGIISPNESESVTDNLLIGLNVEHFIGDYWTINARLGYSDTQENSFSRSTNWFEKGESNGDYCSVDYVNGPNGDFLPEMNMCTKFDVTRPDGIKLGQYYQGVRDVDDNKTSFHLDTERVFDDSFITSVEFGAKYTERTKYVRDESMRLGKQYFEAHNFDAVGITDHNITDGRFLDGIAPAGSPGSWLFPDIDQTIAIFAPNGIKEDGFDPDPSKAAEQSETTYGAYVQTNYELLDGIIRGNLGIRYAKTEIEGNTESSIRFLSGLDYVEAYMALPENGGDATETRYEFNNFETNSYDNWLPSATLIWTIQEDLLFRAAAARVMARPKIRDTRPSYSIRVDSDVNEPSGKGGNVQLDAFVADQYDVALEWYFEEGALLSANLFYKDYASFNYKTTIDRSLTGKDYPLFGQPGAPDCLVDQSLVTVDNPTPCAVIPYSTVTNGGSADILGLEMIYQQNYDFLPGLLQYLGSSINYTYADSKAIVNPDDPESPYNSLQFPKTSKHSANARIFWQDNWSSYRLAYSYRSRSINDPANGPSTTIREARGTLDFSANWDITNKLKLSFSATNLTNSSNKVINVLTNTRGYEDNAGVVREVSNNLDNLSDVRVVSIDSPSRSYRLSLRYKF